MARTSAATNRPQLNGMRILAWLYAALFVGVVAFGYIPGVTNEQGELLGLFSIQLRDDLLHLASGIWAGVAAWHSTRASTFYFKTFGTIYFFDGVVGLLTGQGYLDGGIFVHGITPLDWVTKFATNLPHIILGGSAMFIGFVLSRRFAGRG